MIENGIVTCDYSGCRTTIEYKNLKPHEIAGWLKFDGWRRKTIHNNKFYTFVKQDTKHLHFCPKCSIKNKL